MKYDQLLENYYHGCAWNGQNFTVYHDIATSEIPISITYVTGLRETDLNRTLEVMR